MSPSTQEVAAIVLDCQDHGESDQIVTFFCQNIGRMTGIAKGAKRSRKRFVNKLELFSSLRIRYREPKNGSLVFIVEAELVDSFIRLRQNISLYMAATVMRELALAATRDLQGDDGFFSLLQWGFQAMDGQRPSLRRGDCSYNRLAGGCFRGLAGTGAMGLVGSAPFHVFLPRPVLNVLAMFQVKFFEQIGYRPNLDSCLRCNQPLRAGREYAFDSRGGGIVCGRCRDEAGQSSLLSVSLGTIKSLASAQNQALHRLHRLHLSDLGLNEALSLLSQYGQHLLQREICSLKPLSDACRQSEGNIR